MKNTTKNIFKILGGLSIACFALVALSSTNEGTVLDENGKPVKGAYIVAYWTASVGIAAESRTQCYHSDITTTDENGHFRVSRFSSIDPLKRDRKRYVEVLVPGYQLKPDSTRELIFTVMPLAGTKSQQFQRVYSFYRGAACGNEEAFLPTLKARYKELVRLAETKGEIKICNSLLWDIEDIEYGSKIADERRMQRNLAEPTLAVSPQPPTRIDLPQRCEKSSCVISNSNGQNLNQPANVIPGDSNLLKGNK